MKTKFDIDDIRILLHKYYEAETTPEEELLLESFFRATPSEDIPEDLAEDGCIFSSLEEFHPSNAEMEIPEGLFEKISEITEISEIKHTEIHSNWPRRMGYVIAAACACILVALGIKQMTAPKDIETKPEEYAAQSPTESPTEIQTDPPVLPINEVNQPTSPEQNHISNMHRSRRRNVMAENRAAYNEIEDGFIEITDPEEVERIAMEIGKLISRNSEKANDAIVQIGQTVEDYKQLTKSIMQ
ncbi:MAG: hypothetical protein K2H38_11995 [Muribaculaceae bacterium]|nr:hypothetical protein [Muribaculaceae bacterium]MDE6553734.1 hypothetical protein [Muribaculaceae bacterium]